MTGDHAARPEPTLMLRAGDEDCLFATAEFCRRRLGRIEAGLLPVLELGAVVEHAHDFADALAWFFAHRRQPEPRPEMRLALTLLLAEIIARCARLAAQHRTDQQPSLPAWAADAAIAGRG
jgi:hypothetical protein